jgi:hypothetical protein
VIYAVATSVGIRRLASESYRQDDISLKKLLDEAIRDPRDLWPSFERNFPNEAGIAISAAHRSINADFETNACRRLISEDRALAAAAVQEIGRVRE